jgi:hypothetical protein
MQYLLTSRSSTPQAKGNLLMNVFTATSPHSLPDKLLWNTRKLPIVRENECPGK